MGIVELFVRIAIGVLVGGLLGAGVAYWTPLPAWQVGAGAGALSAVIGTWAISSLRGSSQPTNGGAPLEPPDSPRQPSI